MTQRYQQIRHFMNVFAHLNKSITFKLKVQWSSFYKRPD